MDACNLALSLARAAGDIARLAAYTEGESIFVQGDEADSVFYIRHGRVKFTIVSKSGKAGVVAMLKAGQFFGESCIIGHTIRVMTATAMTPCSLMRIEKAAMVRLLREQPVLAESFISFLVDQRIQYERGLVDQLFNSAEKRLARVLLLLSSDIQEGPDGVIDKISQETLAEIVGTTRSRINYFMNKFRGLGFLEYNGEIRVRRDLLSRFLHDSQASGVEEFFVKPRSSNGQ